MPGNSPATMRGFVMCGAVSAMTPWEQLKASIALGDPTIAQQTAWELFLAETIARELETIPTLDDIDQAIAHHRDTFLWLGPRAGWVMAKVDDLLELRDIVASWWA